MDGKSNHQQETEAFAFKEIRGDDTVTRMANAPDRLMSSSDIGLIEKLVA